MKSDYVFIALIKGLVRKHGCSVLLISHSRKDSASSEKVDSIDCHLGTTGLTAAVDAVMLLTGADDTKKILKVKGRDISPFEVHLELQVDDRTGWVAVDAPAAPEKKLGALRQRILDAVLAIGPCGPDAISKATGDNASTIRVYLPRMVKDGQVVKDSSGCYGLVEHTPSVTGVAPVAPVAGDQATATPATPATPVSAPTPPVAPTQPSVIATPAPAPVAPTQPAWLLTDAEMAEKITWHVQHGVGDPVALAKACGRTYDFVNRAAKELERQNIIRMIDGGWQMVTPVPAATPTSKSTLVEYGGVKETTMKNTDTASPVGSPTQQVLFVNPKTRKTWKIGQDVDCLSTELKIPKGEAEALLGYGKYAGQILAIVKNWDSYSGADSKTAYLHGILKKLAASSKANKPAAATSKPLPPHAPAASTARNDALVRDAIHAMGNNKYTVEQIAEQITRGGVACTNIQKLQAHLASMIRRGLVHFVQGVDRVVRYSSLEARKPSVISTAPVVHEDMASMRSRQMQQEQTERDEVHADVVARLDREMAQAPAVAVEVPATPAPAPELSLRNRILAAIDSEPKNFSQLSATTGINCGDLSHAVYEMIDAS